MKAESRQPSHANMPRWAHCRASSAAMGGLCWTLTTISKPVASCKTMTQTREDSCRWRGVSCFVTVGALVTRRRCAVILLLLYASTPTCRRVGFRVAINRLGQVGDRRLQQRLPYEQL